MSITKQQLTDKEYDVSDFALLISEGNDYDDICQHAITQIAEDLGIAEDWDSEEYQTIAEWVNEEVGNQLESEAEDDEMGW